MQDRNRKKYMNTAPRTKQMRGVPDFPTVALTPVLEKGAFWNVNKDYIVDGLVFEGDGAVAFAPVPIPRMRMLAFHVVMEFTSFADTKFLASYRFRKVDGSAVEMVTGDHNGNVMPITCKKGESHRWSFKIPLEEIHTDWMLAGSLIIRLSDLPINGQEPMGLGGGPLVIRNVWIQIDD